MILRKILCFIYFLLPAFLLISCKSISLKTYNLKTSSLAEKSGITVVLISDLHSTVHGKDQSVLIGMIRELKPDIIALTGDIYDDVFPDAGTLMLLSGISNSAQIFYVTGNHEYMRKNMETALNELLSFGVTILSDDYVITKINGNKIILAGVEDPYIAKKKKGYDQNEIMKTAFRQLDDIPLYKILLAHRPENIEEYKKYSFDLVLSGHTHGGQVRIPGILDGLYAPHQGLFPKYSGGIYSHGSLTHVISRGLSIYPFIPRIFNPPELVAVRIEADDKN
ncbi:MAG: metallophosphoesterase [Treponema sp.]|nr:metallophosphoesterase [Treponema sp.]